MRVAIWSPLPPDSSGIADFTYDLVDVLARDVDITVIVRDKDSGKVVPHGVMVRTADEYQSDRYDLDIYQIGNHAGLHSYIFSQAMRQPGVVELHDPALVDFYAGLLGGTDNTIFKEEVAYNIGEARSIPYIWTEEGPEPDRLAILLCRRLLERSMLTLVHSTTIRDDLLHRWPGVSVEYIPLATRSMARHDRSPDEAIAFGIFGGISRHKRIMSGLRAFLDVNLEYPETRLHIAGRRDEPQLADRIADYVREHARPGSVTIRFDAAPEELDALIQQSDVILAQRWPTAGETSATLMRAFGAGRAAIASDILQNREFDRRFVDLIPVGDGEEACLRLSLARAAENPCGVRAAGRAAHDFIKANATPDRVAAKLLDHFATLAATPSRRFSTTAPRVNAIASWASTTGLTEAARRTVSALIDADVEVAIEDYDFGSPRDPGRFPPRFTGLVTGRPYSLDLCFLNVNELQVLPDQYLRGGGHYVIGSWFWELPSIPQHIQRQLRRVDEIWVASQFVRDAFSQYTRAHIEVVPCVVEPTPSPDVERSRFGIPSSGCVFLASFDANSTLARKNPWGVIDAYSQAFSAAERGCDVQLVVKTINLRSLPEADTRLREELARVGGVLIDDELTAGDNAALTAACDVFVSLHRAEGFGLGIAEAMYFGRPCIVTAYSGNIDFTDASNSCQVGYSLRSINLGELRYNPHAELIYEPGGLWAEPDLSQASRWMRLLFENPLLRHQIGGAGSKTIKERMGAAAVGQALRHRLRTIMAR